MIIEDYCSFEVAKLLKEKGFNEPCHATYDIAVTGGKPKFSEYEVLSFFPNGMRNTDDKYNMVISAPTLQMAMRWLRIEHNIHIEPHIVKTKRSYGYMPNYIDLKELKQKFPFDEVDFSDADKYVCITYDKACEVTIKYCLEHLI